MENYKLLLLEENHNLFLDGIDMRKKAIIDHKTSVGFYDFIEAKLAVDEVSGCKSIVTTEYNGKNLKKKKELYVLEEQFEKIKRIIFEFAITISFCSSNNDKGIDFKYYWEAIEYINYVRRKKHPVYVEQNNTIKVIPSQTIIDGKVINSKYDEIFQKSKKLTTH